MNRRSFVGSMAALVGLGGVSAVPGPPSEAEAVFARLDRQLCDGLIRKTRGCVRTLHGCDRCPKTGAPVIDDPNVVKCGRRGVYAYIDTGYWPANGRLLRWHRFTVKTSVGRRLSLEPYLEDVGGGFRVAVLAETDGWVGDATWREVLAMFARKYPRDA